jgi:rare lipoprotein A
MFPLGVAAALLVSSAGCAVVGYPAPLRDPLTVTAPARPPAPAVDTAPPPRRFADPDEAIALHTSVRTYEVLGQTYTTLASSEGYGEVGLASWYGEPFHGRPTASGERFDMYALTAAHRTLPLSTCVEVRRLDDDRAVTVRVNDRGPFDDDARRIIDLSYAAGRTLGLIGAGTAEVEVRALQSGTAC